MKRLAMPTLHLKRGAMYSCKRKEAFFRGKKKYHYVKEGETMYDISQMYGVRLDKLYWRNMMPDGSQPLVRERIRLKGRTKGSSGAAEVYY